MLTQLWAPSGAWGLVHGRTWEEVRALRILAVPPASRLSVTKGLIGDQMREAPHIKLQLLPSGYRRLPPSTPPLCCTPALVVYLSPRWAGSARFHCCVCIGPPGLMSKFGRLLTFGTLNSGAREPTQFRSQRSCWGMSGQGNLGVPMHTLTLRPSLVLCCPTGSCGLGHVWCGEPIWR